MTRSMMFAVMTMANHNDRPMTDSDSDNNGNDNNDHRQ